MWVWPCCGVVQVSGVGRFGEAILVGVWGEVWRTVDGVEHGDGGGAGIGVIGVGNCERDSGQGMKYTCNN